MSCAAKLSYSTRDEAEQVGARRLAAETRLFVYQCLECGSWHLTRGENLPSVRARLYPVSQLPISAPSRGTTLGELLAFKADKTQISGESK